MIVMLDVKSRELKTDSNTLDLVNVKSEREDAMYERFDTHCFEMHSCVCRCFDDCGVFPLWLTDDPLSSRIGKVKVMKDLPEPCLCYKYNIVSVEKRPWN